LELHRLRRCKVALINLSFRHALEKLLAQLLRKPLDFYADRLEREHDLMRKWMSDGPDRMEVLDLLKSFRLDESAIEAEAIRQCLSDLELLERSLESRRNKVVACIAEYRESLSRRLRESSDRYLEDNPVLH
jgi:hypothetical protein